MVADKQVKGDKFWRSAALLFLCALVYYFSYDHGRKSVLPSLEALKTETVQELENQRLEILRLRAALAECDLKTAEQPPSLDRLPLRVNQSKILFNGRLVVALLKVENTEGTAVVQLNFVEEGRIVVEELATGGSLRFDMDGQNWAIVLSALQISSANLNLVELKGAL